MLPSLALLGALSGDPDIVVYTMGPGRDFFERFGHAAICVEERARGRCYNYGTTDFQTPPEKIGWEFVRGNSRFWVSLWDKDRMLRAYIAADRDVYRQVLPLSIEQKRRVILRLESDNREENRYYHYHHFDDNCTTRVRDVIDEATGGRLLREAGLSAQVTRRQLGAQGLAEWPLAVAVGQLFAGPRLDQDMTRGEAMFLPRYLRQELESELGARAERVNARRGSAFPQDEPSTWPIFAAWVASLSLPLVVLRRRPRATRVFVAVCGVLLGLVGVGVWAMSMLAQMQELRVNQALLLFWPTDALLGALRPRARVSYARLRAVAAACVLLLSALGVIQQPLVLPALTVLLPMAWLGWAAPDRARRATGRVPAAKPG